MVEVDKLEQYYNRKNHPKYKRCFTVGAKMLYRRSGFARFITSRQEGINYLSRQFDHKFTPGKNYPKYKQFVSWLER